MIEQDTIKLLRECDAGVKMGIASLEDVIDQAHTPQLRDALDRCLKEHQDLHKKIQERLQRFQDEGKDPNPIAKGMSWIKTSVMMGLQDKDSTIASLMTDGCHMGVKSLSRYLNEYEAAEEYAKDMAKKLIKLEETLANDLKKYL